jgi:hypothetical protein
MKSNRFGLWPRDKQLWVSVNKPVEDELRRAAREQYTSVSAVIWELLVDWAEQRDRIRALAEKEIALPEAATR